MRRTPADSGPFSWAVPSIATAGLRHSSLPTGEGQNDHWQGHGNYRIVSWLGSGSQDSAKKYMGRMWRGRVAGRRRVRAEVTMCLAVRMRGSRGGDERMVVVWRGTRERWQRPEESGLFLGRNRIGKRVVRSRRWWGKSCPIRGKTSVRRSATPPESGRIAGRQRRYFFNSMVTSTSGQRLVAGWIEGRAMILVNSLLSTEIESR